MLTESLLPEKDEDSPRRSRQQSLIRASTVNMRDYRTSGIEFQRFTVKKSLMVGQTKRNVFAASAINEEHQPLERAERNESVSDIDNIINDFQRRDRMEASDASLHSVDSHHSQISSTFYDGDVFYEVREAGEVESKPSIVANGKSQLEKPSAIGVIMKSIVERMSLNQSSISKQGRTKGQNKIKTRRKMKRLFSKNKLTKKKQTLKIPLGQRVSKFFGEGINSLILTLGNSVVTFLTINLLLDVLFRVAVLLYCVRLFLWGVDYKPPEGAQASPTYRFLIPIGSMMFCRVVFFVTLIKMSFDEKSTVCDTFQQWTGDKSRSELEEDRLFMRQWKRSRIVRTICRAMIPPELWFWEIENPSRRRKMYFLINMIFKGIEIVFLLGTMLIILTVTISRDPEYMQLRLTGYGIMLEEVIRYVVNYLIINTLSP